MVWIRRAALSLAAALAAVGCQSYSKLASVPAAAGITSPSPGTVPLAAAAPPPLAAGAAYELPAPPTESRPLGPFPKLSEQQALQSVLPQLEQLAAEDPSLHSAVLKQMASTEPSLWPATVERAKSTALYKTQLAQRANPTTPATRLTETQPAAGSPFGSPPLRVADRRSSPLAPPASRPNAEANHAGEAATPANPPAATTPTVPQVIENRHASASTEQSTIRLVSANAGEAPPTLATAEEPPSVGPPSPAARDWRANLDAAIAALEADVADAPRSSAEAYRHVRLRLLRLAAGRSDDAVSPTPGLSTTEQGFWSKQLFALSTLLDAAATRDLGGRAAAATHHQAEASAALGQLGDLRIENLTFCDEVYGFGAYDPIDAPRFTAGQSVSLYTEVENYRSESTEEGYRTSLATSYRVVDRHGALVDSGEFPVVEDLCLSRRRDFHIQYSVTLPTTVYPGEYRLQLTITDQLGDKIGDDEIAFEIVSK